MPLRDVPEDLSGRAFTLEEAWHVHVSRDSLRHPRFDHPHHGVYADGLDPYTLLDRCRALAPVLGPGQCFSHLTAARLWGMPLPETYRYDEPMHVLTAASAAPIRRPGVVGWETAVPVRGARVDDLPVSEPAAIWVQLSTPGAVSPRRGLSTEWLVAVGDFLVTGGRSDRGRLPALCSLADLEHARRDHAGRRGAKSLATALPLVRAGAESPKETELRLALVAYGLPEPAIQVAVSTRSGVRHADLGYPEARLLLEYQGDEHRVSRERWLQDLTRVQLLEDAGFRVMLIGAHDMVDGCHALARRIHRALSTSRDFTIGPAARRVGTQM